MSSIPSVNPGIADLLQTFSITSASPLSSSLSSPAVQEALQSASPADLADLSQEALQYQQVAGLLGTPDTSGATTDPGALLLQTLENQSAASGSTQSGSSSSLSASATYAAATETFASQEESALFGTNSTTGNSSINLLG